MSTITRFRFQATASAHYLIEAIAEMRTWIAPNRPGFEVIIALIAGAAMNVLHPKVFEWSASPRFFEVLSGGHMKSLSAIFATIVLATISFAQGHGGYGGGGHRSYAAGAVYGGHGYGAGGFTGHSARGYVATPAGSNHGFASVPYRGRGYHGYGISIGSGYTYSHSAYGPGNYSHYGWYRAPSFPYLGHGYYSYPYVPAFPPPVAGGVAVVAPSHGLPSRAPIRVVAGSGWRRFAGH